MSVILPFQGLMVNLEAHGAFDRPTRWSPRNALITLDESTCECQVPPMGWFNVLEYSWRSWDPKSTPPSFAEAKEFIQVYHHLHLRYFTAIVFRFPEPLIQCFFSVFFRSDRRGSSGNCGSEISHPTLLHHELPPELLRFWFHESVKKKSYHLRHGTWGKKKQPTKGKLPTSKMSAEMLFWQKLMFHFIKIPSVHGREMALSLDKLLQSPHKPMETQANMAVEPRSREDILEPQGGLLSSDATGSYDGKSSFPSR